VGRRAHDRARAQRSRGGRRARDRHRLRLPDRRARAVANKVWTVERIGALVAKARRNLQALKVSNVALKHGDGSAELGEELSVDAIVVTAGATHVPTKLLRYLKPGGRMVIPLGASDEGERGTQYLTVIEAGPGGFREQRLDAVRFVPLLPGLA